MNLVSYQKDGLELVINQKTGETFASISAVSRVIDKDNGFINRHVKGKLGTSAWMPLFEVKVPTMTGLKTAA
jgi:hypothetical protein